MHILPLLLHRPFQGYSSEKIKEGQMVIPSIENVISNHPNGRPPHIFQQ